MKARFLCHAERLDLQKLADAPAMFRVKMIEPGKSRPASQCQISMLAPIYIDCAVQVGTWGYVEPLALVQVRNPNQAEHKSQQPH